MYSDDVTRIPKNERDLWKVLRKQFVFVRNVLWETPVETKEDALTNKYHNASNGKVSRDGMGVIRYRNIGEALDQREHYLKMGRDLLPYIHQTLDYPELTPEFVQQWGKVMFCHGFIAAHVFDDSDDLANQRGGQKTKTKTSKVVQKVWVAHLLKALNDKGLSRDSAERAIVAHIKAIIARGGYEPHFPICWFQDLLRKNGREIKRTYGDRSIKIKELDKWIARKVGRLPPTVL